MVINEQGVLKVYEKILRHKKKVNISIESKRIAKIFDYNPKIVYGIIKKKATEEFREDEHPRDSDGKFATKGNGTDTGGKSKQEIFDTPSLWDTYKPELITTKSEFEKSRAEQDKEANLFGEQVYCDYCSSYIPKNKWNSHQEEKSHDENKKENTPAFIRDWNERKKEDRIQNWKDGYNEDMILDDLSDVDWTKSRRWRIYDTKIKNLEEQQEKDELTRIKLRGKTMSEPIDEKYDSTRMITPSNVKKMLKDYTFDPKNRFNSKYDGKDPELQATFRVYDSANRKLTNDLDRSSNLSWDSLEFYGNKRFIDVDEITPDIITAYCNLEAGRNKGIETYEQELSRIKLKLKLAKSTGISPYDVPDQSDDFGHKMRMTMASLEVKYGTLFKKYEERDNTHTKFLDEEHEVINPKQGERIMTKEEASVISDLYEELPKEVTEFRKMYNEEKKKISRMKGREVLLEESIQQLKDDGKYEVVTPLIHDGYTITAIPEHVDGGKSYYNTEKSNIENLYKKLSKLKKFDYHEGNANYMERGLSSQRFTTRLFAKNGYNFNIGGKTYVSGGHWSNGNGEIAFFGCKNKTIREDTTIAEHEFGHSQYDAIGHYVRGFDQSKSRIEKKFKSKETLRKHYWRFNDEVGLLKEGEVIDVYSKYEKAIRKHQPTFNTDDDITYKDGEPSYLSDLLPDKSVAKFLEGLRRSDIGLVEGIAPEDVFTDYFMDYVRSRDKKIKGEASGNVQTEMFACLSELRVSDKQKDREKYIYAKIAFPKLVKSFEYLSGYKGFPDDEVTEDLMLWSGFNDVEEYNKMLSSIEVRKKAYEITHYLTYDYKVVENEEESDMIFVKKYDKNDKLIGMEVYSEVEDDSEENRLSIVTEAEFKEEEHPREDDGKFTDKGGGVGKKAKTRRRRKSRSKTKTARRKVKRSKIKMRSRKSKDSGQRKHNIKTYPNTKVVITGITTNTYDKTFSPELVTIFEDFWNSDLSVKKMRKHIDYLGLLYQKNPKRGGFWNTLEKKVVIYDAYWQTPSHFKNTVVHEIVGHTFWDLAREYFRNDLIEFNELANKMPPVNGYVKDNEEAWKNYNDEIHTQMQVLDKKYGLDDFTSPEDKLWGDKLEKYQEDYAKISDGKFIGNPSNKFMNRDSSSMTRYANEQHSAITEIIYRTLNGSFEEGAKDILIGKEDKEKLIKAWYKLHPNVPQKAGESWNDPFKNHSNIISTEEFKEQEHPRGQPDNAGQFVSKGGGSSKDAIHGEKVKKYEATLDIEPKKEDVDKAVNIESKVIGGVYDFIKDKSYKDKIKWVETQGSFAKGTDLGSSDLDIFIGFDYSLSIDEIQEITLDIGKNVLKPISDSDKYKIKHGADKDYPESYVDGIEVQIIGTSDVTLDQIRKGYDEGGMKTATDRTPHHTRFMKKALKGKEQEVRKLKRFFKDSGVYDSSMAKQGFSGFSTEVLIHNLGSFAKVIGYFANFIKGSVVGNTDRKFDTPLVMIDPLDPNRNLASAFSHSEKDGNIAPNKNLARLIKSAKSLVKTGKLPKITKEKLPSVSVSFHVDNTIDNNEVFGQLYSSALSMSATLKRNGYIVKSPKDKITKDFTVDVPRINVDYDEDSGKATLNFALDNFDKEKRYVGGIPEDLSDDKLRAFYDNHKGEKLVKKNGKIYAEQENEYPTAEKLMKAIVSGEKKNSTVGKLERYIKQAVISKEDREYENITDKPNSTEGLSKILNTNDYIKEDDVRQLAKDLLEAERY